MNSLVRNISLLDKLAVSASMVCAIHCLFLPVILVVFPALGATLFADDLFHVLLLWLIIPLSVIALSLGCRRHKDLLVAVIGLVGLTFLISASLGHEFLGETNERILTIMGAAVISVGHLQNYRLCRRDECDH